MRGSATAITLISCLIINLTSGNEFKISETQVSDGRLGVRHAIQDRIQIPQYPILTEMSVQIGEPHRQNSLKQSTIASTTNEFKPTAADGTQRAPTTTVRPNHGQIPRPVILVRYDPATVAEPFYS